MSKFSIEVKEILADVKKEKENLESGKVKMNEVREENERLKLTLSQMMEEYHSLKMHLNDIVQQDEEPKKFMDSNSDDSDLVSLCLGRVSAKKEEKKNISNENIKQLENGKVFDGLELGLECKFHLENSTKASKDNSPEKCSEGSKEDVSNESRARDKSPKNSRSEDDDVLLQNPLKKPRVSIRAVCDTQTMNDGCQWRKYGQKIAKGNPCPRAYYRCTLSSSCPVRKQVQRCADNMSILITTYEGAHNHPLPASATTMASTTTAAAAMLNCGSTTSSTNHNNLLGFQFTSSNHHLSNSYFPRASISTSQSHPTVILDLTTPPNPSSSLFNKFIPSTLFSSPLSSSSSLNFSHSNTLKTTWDAKIHTTNHISTSSYMATTSQPYNYKKNQEETVGRDEIAIATKAITRDPTFQSALAATITSFVGNGTSNASTSSQERNVKLSHNQMDFQLSFSQPSTGNGIVACATSYLNKFNDQTMNWQQKNLSSFPPFTIVSTSKSVAPTTTLADHEGDKL